MKGLREKRFSAVVSIRVQANNIADRGALPRGSCVAAKGREGPTKFFFYYKNGESRPFWCAHYEWRPLDLFHSAPLTLLSLLYYIEVNRLHDDPDATSVRLKSRNKNSSSRAAHHPLSLSRAQAYLFRDFRCSRPSATSPFFRSFHARRLLKFSFAY